MSKPFLRGLPEESLGAFANLLPKVAEAKTTVSKVSLGKTAEGLLKLKEEARAQGYEEGYHEGFVVAQEDAFEATRMAQVASVAEFSRALDAAAGRVEEAIAQWYVDAEAGLAALSVSIATRILGRELEISQDAITDLTRQAIREVATADKVRIRVNPFDAPILERHRDKVLAANPTVRGVEIVADASFEGGSKIESDSGLIDATVRTQLELAFESLRRAA